MITSVGPFTVHDLAALADDGRRHELIDGSLVLTPAPGARHQKVVATLGALLDAGCPPHLHVLPGPFAVRPSETLELRPALLVAGAADLTPTLLPAAPTLAVEISSPESTLLDHHTRKAAYQRLGVPSYWIVDPLEPRLTVFELTPAGRYETVAEIKDDNTFDAERPFPVRIVPRALLGTLI